MKRPKKLRIGPHTFKVVWSLKEMVSINRVDGQDRHGCTDLSQLVINIDGERPGSAVKDTFIHEMLHAILWSNGIDVPEDKDASEENREEKLVSQLGGHILLAMQQNPKVVDWLMSEEG